MLIDIIDDEPHVRDALFEIVEILGYRAKKHSSAVEYIDYAMSPTYEHPNVIISDVRMPVMDGYTMMRKVHELFPEIPFIIVTGYQDVKDKYSDIPHEFMRKPFNPEVLEKAIERLYTISARKLRSASNLA